jgi:PadR family transcriptional regulator, regulatory protein AphA
MSLRFALLALLTAQPMTGYDLAKAFHSSVGHVWHAPNSQIYPELRKMEGEGLVLGETVTWGTRGTKTRYEATPSGIQAFRDWMATPLEYSRERDPAHLRAAYFEWTDADAARAALRAHREHFLALRSQWAEQLELIRTRQHPIVRRRLEVFPESEWARIIAFKEFAYEGLVAQADQEIAWAERGLLLIDELDTDHSGGFGTRKWIS